MQVVRDQLAPPVRLCQTEFRREGFMPKIESLFGARLRAAG